MARMTADEIRRYRESGFLVRRSVFSEREVGALRGAVDAVAERVTARRSGCPMVTGCSSRANRPCSGNGWTGPRRSG